MKKQDINWTEVEHMLDRFYEGTTTHEEERCLMELLTGDDVPECLAADAEVFRALADETALQQTAPEPPEGLEHRLMERIRQEEASSIAPVIPLRPSKKTARRWWIAAAACLVVVLLSAPHLLRDVTVETPLYASSEISQQEAEEYADYALAMISSHLKAGVQELDEIGRAQAQIRASLNEIVN